MKRLLIFLLILSSLAANAQVWLPRNNNYGQSTNRESPDSVLFFPTGCGTPLDTNWLNSHSKTGSGNLLKWAIYGDSCAGIVYFWNPSAQTWTAVGAGGATDTTSLSARINSKVNITDTGTMLQNYIRAAVATASFYPISNNPAGYSILPNVINQLQVINYAGLTGIGASIYSARPTAGIVGRLWVATDTLKIYYDNGSTWLTIAGGGGGSGTTSFAALTGQPTDNTNLATALSGKLGVTNNLDDLNSVTAAKTNLGLNNVANVNSQNASTLNSGTVPLAQIDTGTLATRARAQQKIDSLATQKINGQGLVISGLYASRPTTPAYSAAYYYATDSAAYYYWNGSSWVQTTYTYGKVFHLMIRAGGQPGDTTFISAHDSTIVVAAIRDSGALVHYSNPDGSKTFYVPTTSSGTTNLTPSSNSTSITVTPTTPGTAAVFNSATHTNAGPQSAADKQREDSTTYVVNRDGISGADTLGFFDGDTLVLKSFELNNDGDMVVTSHTNQNTVIWGAKADTTTGSTKLATQGFVTRAVASPSAGLTAGQHVTTDPITGLFSTQAEILHQPVLLATAAALPSNTYSGGVLTATSNAALTIDGVATAAGNRILVKNESNQANNGIYTVTQTGSGAAPYILTRGSYSSIAANLIAGSNCYVQSGTANANTVWYQQTTGAVTVGTTNLVYAQTTGSGGSLPPNIGTGVNVYAPQIPGFRRITAISPLVIDTTTTANSITITADTASSVLTNFATYAWILDQGYTNFFWINVKNYGAYGDGVHDDTYAIRMAAAACGSMGTVLYFPPGRYIVSGSIRLPYKVQVLGCGGSNAGIFNSVTPSTAFYRDSTTDITQIWSTSASDTVFVFGGSGSSVSGMNIILATGVTPTSTNVGIYGAGTSLKLKDMGVGSFYNCVDDTAAVEVTISDVFIWNPVNYGLWMQNRKNADGGDNSCIQSFFYAGNNNTRAMVRLENGGWKFMQNKWNANAGYSGEAQIGIWLEIYGSAGSTSDLNLSGNSYENISDTVIYLHASGGGIFYNAQINGEQISPYSNAWGIVENGLSGFMINNCVISAASSAGIYAIYATDAPQTFVGNFINGGNPATTPTIYTSANYMSNIVGGNTLLNLSGSYSGLMNAGITNTSASGYISWNVFGSGSNGAIIRTYGPSFSVSSLRNIALFSGTQNVMLGSITSGYPTNIVGGSTTPLITATGALVQFPQIASNIIDSTNFKVAVIRQSDQSIFQTNWPTFGSGGSGVTSFGTPTTSYANGATVSGTTAYLGLASSSNPGIIAGSGAQTLGATLTLSNALTVNAAISTSSTHGVNISAKNDLTSQSGAGTITSYAVPGSGSNNNFQISAYINILAIVTDILQVQVTFTGEDNASHTVTFYSQGVTSANLTSTGYYPFPPIFVSVKQGTTITASVVFTTGTGSVTYDAGAIITQMY